MVDVNIKKSQTGVYVARVTNAEMRQTLRISVKLPPMYWLRMRLCVILIKMAAWVASMTIEIQTEVEEKSDGDQSSG